MARRDVLVSWFKRRFCSTELIRRQRASYVKLSARRRLLLLSLRLVKMDLGGLPDMVRRVLRFHSTRMYAHSSKRH